jgi:hypothetical protein
VERPKGFNPSGNVGAGGAKLLDDTQLLAQAIMAAPVPQVKGLTREELKRRLEQDRAEFGDPSTCVELLDMVSLDLISDPQEALDITRDIEDQCRELASGGVGELNKIWLPVKEGQGVLVRMTTMAAAQRVFDGLLGKTFEGKKIRCKFVPTTTCDQRDADLADKQR